MKTEVSPVNATIEKGKKPVTVGKASYPIFENLDEAKNLLGEAKALELLNVQVKTSEMNRVRQTAVGKPSKTALREKAFASLTVEEFKSCVGDPNKINALIESRMADIEKKENEERAARLAAATPAEEGGEGTDEAEQA